MNGAGPLDRAQPLDLSMLLGRTRAQTSCPVFSCNNPIERHLVLGSHDTEAPNNSRMKRAARPYSSTRD